MSKKQTEKINLCASLGVSNKRMEEIGAELKLLEAESQYLDEMLAALAERYDPDTLVMGMVLGVLVLHKVGPLSPPHVRCAPINPALS